MRRGLFLLTTWLVGSLAATALAWAAVGVVRANVTDRRLAPLSAQAVTEALDTTPDSDGATSTTGTVAETTTTSTSANKRGGSVTTTTRAGTSGKPGSRQIAGGSAGGTVGGSGSPTDGGSGGSSTTPTTSVVRHPFSVTRADGTIVGSGSFSCDGNNVTNRTASPAQGWNGPHTYSQSTDQTWVFEVDSNSGGKKTKVTVTCPDGNSRVDESDLDNNV